jgi:hypothetical protein
VAIDRSYNRVIHVGAEFLPRAYRQRALASKLCLLGKETIDGREGERGRRKGIDWRHG